MSRSHESDVSSLVHLFFVVAGAAAALGTGLWLLPKSGGAGSKERAALLVPVAAPAGGGLLLRGRC